LVSNMRFEEKPNNTCGIVNNKEFPNLTSKRFQWYLYYDGIVRFFLATKYSTRRQNIRGSGDGFHVLATHGKGAGKLHPQ
jgi:hypothetical protein